MVRSAALIFSLLAGLASSTLLKVESGGGGVYSRLTASIDGAAVPREHCKTAISNFQVRTTRSRKTAQIPGFPFSALAIAEYLSSSLVPRYAGGRQTDADGRRQILVPDPEDVGLGAKCPL